MRLENGAKLREAERDRGGGGKWDGGRFKSYDNGAGFLPWPSSCKSLNVIMTTKVSLPAHLPVAACEQGSLFEPHSISLGSRWKNEQLPQAQLGTRKEPWKIKQVAERSRNSPRLTKPVRFCGGLSCSSDMLMMEKWLFTCLIV